jgi:glycosyltransferase involved in cell wall biosynthesis
MRDFRVDIIHAQWSYEFAMAALSADAPALVTVRDHALKVLKYQIDPYRMVRYLMNQYVVHSARFLATNSNYLYTTLSRRNQRKTKVVPNFLANVVKSKYDNSITKEHAVITVSNGFGRIKNIDSALKAFASIRKKTHAEYWLVGDDMHVGGRAYTYALNNNLTENVRFLGPVPYSETLSLISRAKVLLHPSREESFGMTVLDSMALGTSVVGGRTSGNIPFLLDHGTAGLLCDVENPNDIAEKVLSLLEHDDIRRRKERYAHALATQTYAEDIVISQYLDYYQEILKTQ